jgi:cytosine/adenosine deaminase-related metal-dependent hydrolase
MVLTLNHLKCPFMTKRIALAALLLAAHSFAAQEKPVILQAGTLLDGRGHVLHNVQIVVQGNLQNEIGAIAPGMQADIIALDGDPLKNITAVRRVVFVMKGGKIYRNEIGGR